MAYYQKEIETASREELNRLQSERLVNTVRRVYERVPLYRQRMDEAGVKPEDIQKALKISEEVALYFQTGFTRYLSLWNVCRSHGGSGAVARLQRNHRKADRGRGMPKRI